MKAFKRLISVLLAVLLVICASPVSAFANEEIPEECKIYGNIIEGYDDPYDYLGQFPYSGGSDSSDPAGALVKWTWTPETQTLYVYADEEGAWLDSFYNLVCPTYYVFSDAEIAEMDAKGEEHDDGYWDDMEAVFFRFKHLVIGKNIEKVSYLFLNHYEYLEDVTFDDESCVKIIGGYIFDSATNTRAYNTCDFEIPDTVEELEKSAFICSTFDTLTLPPSVKKIGSYCFAASDIKEIDLSQTSITEVPNYCYYETSTLEQISLPDTVKSFGESAFSGLQLESLTIPSSLESLGEACFEGTTINQAPDFSHTDLSAIPDGCFSMFNTQGDTILLPPNVELIGQSAFSESTIKTIELPAAVTSIGNYAFSGCESLESADLSKTNVRDLKYTFRNCSRLTELLLPDSLLTIQEAVSNCSSLRTFVVPPNTQAITGLYGTKITHLDLPTSIVNVEIYNWEDEVYDFSEFNGGLDLGDDFLKNNDYVKEFIFPRENYTKVPDRALYECENLRNFTLYTCEEIGYRAFADTDIREAVIPDNCTKINGEAFAGCSYLKKVRLSKNLSKLGKNIFKNDNYLKTVIFPSKKKFTYGGASTSRTHEKMYDDGFLCNEGLTVYCYPDTFIEQYCQKYGINYGYIGESPEAPEEPENPDEPTSDPSLIRSGTWKHGIWYIQSSVQSTNRTLFIECNEPSTLDDDCKILTNQNGEASDLVSVIKRFNINVIEFSGTAKTVIPDNFMKDFAYESDMEERSFEINFASCITKIGKNAFRNSNITSIDCTHGVSDLGEYAFADNPMLATVKLGVYVHELKEGVFYNCNITSFNTNDLQKIGKKALCGYHGNKTVNIYLPNQVSEIYGDPAEPWNNAMGATAEGYRDDKVTFYVYYGSPAYYYVKDWGLKYQIRNGYGFETEEEAAAPPKYDITKPETPSPDEPQPPEPVVIDGFFSTDEDIKKNNSKAGTWTYRADSKTLFIKGGFDFNRYDFYYSDKTKMQKGDLEVDKVILQGSIHSIYGEVLREADSWHLAEYSKTTLSFFNPKVIDYSSCSIYNIYKGAFNDCTRLESITVPSGAWVSNEAFENTPSLKSVVFEDRDTIPQNFLKGNKTVEFIKLPDNLYSIGANAFAYCSNLQQIEIPDSCVSIGMKAFYKCLNVQSVTLGSGINHIGKDAFSDLVNCETVRINTDKIKNQSVSESNRTPFKELGSITQGVSLIFGDAVTKTDFELFKGARLTSVTLGKSISSIDGVENLDYLEEIKVDEENEAFYAENGILYSGTKLVFAPRNLTNIIIKDGTSEIGDAAFYKTKAKTVNIPAGVTKIGDYAFSQSETLKSVTLNRGLETIGECAFEFCTKLKVLLMPTGLKTIGRCAFEGCSILASVILNEQLETIGFDAFRGCEALKGIVIPQSVQLIRIGAFENCTTLEYAYIWDSMIEEDAFNGDDNLVIHTMLASNPYEYAKVNNIEYVAYTDEDAFFTECALKLDAEAGYLGYCNGEHGDIEWLTVTEADCEHDGYMIGVCEYCSEILDERHIDAAGHDYQVVATTAPSASVRGSTLYECSSCHATKLEYSDEEPEGGQVITTQTVTGRIVIADDKAFSRGVAPARKACVMEGDNIIAETNENGEFSLTLESGIHILKLHYAFGFDRTIIAIVENEDLACGDIPILGCDFNRDGAIGDEDTKLFRIALSSKKNDPAYLDYVDLNNDGVINARDYIILKTFNTCTNDGTRYDYLVFQKH